jgi:hypothetical protein
MNDKGCLSNGRCLPAILLIVAVCLLSACSSPSPAVGPAAPQAAPTQVAPEATSTVPAQPSAVPASVTGAATGQATFTDPFAYCAAVGTIDAPDARFVGPKVPVAIVTGLAKALNLPPGTPAPPITQNSFWRCMDGKVYACTVGANLPCQEKADTSQTPTQGMKDFCQANPTSDFIPAYITGHATIYEWRCTNGAPDIVKQVAHTDARGFLANIWYEIKPNDP